MIDCFDRVSSQELEDKKEERVCKTIFMVDKEDLAVLLSGGCLIGKVGEENIAIAIDF